MKAYIAGKITGNEKFQEEFAEAETTLKARGYKIMNPSCLQPGFEQEEYLHVCMAMIDVCDIIYFLPNWIESKGAHFEKGYGIAKNKDIQYYGVR
jgi:nucleoside 2-deoxyribosyltransferase